MTMTIRSTPTRAGTARSRDEIKSTRLVVGMEIHVELATRSKMFTRTANVAHPEYFDAEPNSQIDPIVAALPGTLPVMNKRAVEMAMKVGLALQCTIAAFSKWDRKNYFYPDLPKGYQISQYDLPLCADGAIDIPLPTGEMKRIGIIRAHLEEDTGKLGHELPGGHRYDGSLVDLNRAGTPLLEIVTMPDIESAEEAVVFGKELRNLCRFLGVTEGIMQRGHMRFEPNINVIITTEEGQTHRTPIVEVKNLNSFRAVKGAIEHEAERQVEEWLVSGQVMGPGAKSTRGWDDERGVTILQREKEDAHDYRYFPEPDLVPVVVDENWRQAVRAEIPELPIERRARYEREYGLPAKDCAALVDDRDVCYFYEDCIRAYHELIGSEVPTEHAGHAIAKLLLNAGAKRANELGVGIHELGITPVQVAQIIRLRDDESIGSRVVDDLFARLCESGDDAEVLARAYGMMQVHDESALDAWCDAAIAAEAKAVEDVRGGKLAALGRIVGSVMKQSNGQADAKAVQQKLREKLGV